MSNTNHTDREDFQKSVYTRRKVLKTITTTSACVATAPMVALGRHALSENTLDVYSSRAIDLVLETTVIDMLAPIHLGKSMRMFLEADPYTGNDVISSKRLALMRSSGIDVFHAAIGIDGKHVNVLEFVNDHNSFIANNSDYFMRVDSVEDFDRVKRSGKMGIVIGLQNSEHFHVGRTTDIERFYKAGQRVSQLTYNRSNFIGSGATDRIDGGITDWGVTVVDEMNRLGMAVDISHCGDNTSLDAMSVSKKPVLITHSNSRVLSGGHPRCKPDEVIQAMAKTGGVIGISFIRIFVTGKEPTNIEHLLDHFDYIRDLVGIEHLGLGSDVDVAGYDVLPEEMITRLHAVGAGKYRWREKLDIDGVNYPKKVFDLTEGLIRRGYSNDQIRGILGNNFKRALTDIWV